MIRSFLLTLLMLLWSLNLKAATQVEQGVLDLSNWDGQSRVSLDGNWLSAEDQLVDGHQANLLPSTAWTSIPMPTPPGFEKTPQSGKYQRTYRLSIKGLNAEKPLALFLEFMALHSHRFLFYQPSTDMQYPLAELGHVDHIPSKRLHVYSGNNAIRLPAVNGDGILLIQVNSYPYFKGVIYPYGHYTRIVIGPAENLVKTARRHFFEVSFTLGLFALMGIFNLALFAQRPDEKSSLYIATIALFLAWRYTSTEGYLFQILDGPSYFWFQVNQAGLTFAPSLSGLFLGLFMRSTYPKQVFRYLPHIYMLIIVVQVISSILYSINYAQFNWVYPTMVSLVLFLYCCFANFRAALARVQGSGLGVFGLFTLFLGLGNDFCVATQVYDFVYLGHYSLVVFIIFQSLIVGKRFAHSFKQTKIMGEELLVKNSALQLQQSEIKVLNLSLQEYSETLEQKVEAKTRDIVSILANIRQGILAVNSPDGGMAPEHSKSLESMLGIDKTEAGNVIDVCLAKTDLDADRLDRAKNALSMIIGEDPLAFELNQEALPIEITRLDTQGNAHILELDWSPVVAAGRTEKVLLVLRDVTEVKRLRIAAEDQAYELNLIADIINVPKERFESMIASAEHLIDANRDLLARVDKLDESFIDRLYRNLHTIKGMMRTYNMRQVTNLVHIAEDRYKRMKLGENFDSAILLADAEQIRSLLSKLLIINRQKLGRSASQDQKYLLIDRAQFEENLRNIRDIDFQLLQAADKSRFERIKSLFYKVAYTPLDKVLESQLAGLDQLSRSLAKKAPMISFIDPGFSLNREVHELVNYVFTHLLRNSIDHGIEMPEIREQKGKPAAGILKFRLSLFHGQLRIDYSDDGAGIDLEKIRRKAIEKGWLSEEERVTRRRLLDFLLAPNFSTADRVTEISGRGVGLDAARTYMEEANGSFEIELDQPQSEELKTITAHFVLILPETMFQRVENLDGSADSVAA